MSLVWKKSGRIGIRLKKKKSLVNLFSCTFQGKITVKCMKLVNIFQIPAYLDKVILLNPSKYMTNFEINGNTDCIFPWDYCIILWLFYFWSLCNKLTSFFNPFVACGDEEVKHITFLTITSWLMFINLYVNCWIHSHVLQLNNLTIHDFGMSYNVCLINTLIG